MDLAAQMRAAAPDQGAVARVEALLAPDPALSERTVGSETLWSGSIFSVERLEVELPDGSRAPREVMRHLGGCCVVAVRDGRVCLVRQWRVAIGRMTLELPAGKLEAGEDPAECARRELAEETGLAADSMEPVALSRGVVGCSDELTRVFWARGLHAHPAHPDPGEFVDVAWVDVADVLAAVAAGVIQDSKTVIGVLAVASRLEGSA